MTTHRDADHQIYRSLREALDRERGPDPRWIDSPAASRLAASERRGVRWPLRLLAAAALVGAAGGAALLAGSLGRSPEVWQEISNGWIAYTVDQPDPANVDDDSDIWLVSLDRAPRRAVGTDSDSVDQLCPAFSADGRSLAYGRVEGHGTRYSVDAPGDDRPADYRAAALVVADVSEDGRVTDRLTIDVGDGLPPPCPTWSPDGERVAFGVPHTSPINPTTTAAGSEVWVVRLADRDITILPDLLATDIEWSPDGSTLAITSGADVLVPGEALQDGRIHLYSPSSGALRILDATLGASDLTWAPDGRRIAYSSSWTIGSPVLRVIDLDTGEQEDLTARYEADDGIGPVWSPDGATIAYQRLCPGCREGHDVVLLTPGDPSDPTATPRETLIRGFTNTVGWSVSPTRATWSPDGEYLLWLAGGDPDGTASGKDFLVAVPTDPELPSIVLAEGVSLGEGYPDTAPLPIQSWARRPSN